MRKTVAILLIALLIVGVAACSPSATDGKQGADSRRSGPNTGATSSEAPERIIIDVSEASLFIHDTIELKASGAENLVWSSSNPSVASVDEKGVVHALSAGSATVTVSSAKNSSVKAETVITVGEHVKSVVLEEAELVLLTGSEKADHTLSVQVLPDDALVKKIKYTSSDPSVLTIDEDGRVHAVAPGTATISVVSADEACRDMAQCEVTVKQGVSRIELSQTAAELYQNERVNLTAEVFPKDAEDPTYIWTSSDESVATVNEKGMVTPKSIGKTLIRCSAQDGSEVFEECVVNVVVGIQRIALEKNNATILVGSSEELSTLKMNYTVFPENTFYQSVTWTSSDENIATVDAEGVVHGVAAGRATITAVTTDPHAVKRVKATCIITVGDAVTKIEIVENESRIQKGRNMRYTVKLNPEKPFNPKMQWTSSNEDILKVDGSGNVRALKVGTATITVASTDGSNVSASKQITVYQPVTQLMAVERGNVIVFSGKSVQLHIKALPDDATDKSVTWSTSDAYGAKVDSSGTVSGYAAGIYTVTATAKDGSNKSCNYTVVVEPQKPITLESLGFGIYNANLLGLTVKNQCARTTIKNFDFTIALYTYDGTKLSSSGTYSLGSDENVAPNSTRTIKRTLSGVSWAEKITITIIGVKLADGTYYSIPLTQQETWTVRR